MFDESYHPEPLARPSASSPWTGLLMALAVTVALPTAQGASSSSGPAGTLSDPAELAPSQILDHLYGGSFAAEGDGFSNGSIELERIDDGAERIFQGELVSARTVATFSRNTQTFGVNDGGGFQPLFTVTGSGLEAGGSADLTGRDLSNAIVALQSGGRVVNGTGAAADPLNVYAVSGRGDAGDQKFVLFWEDARAPYSDFDYNDLVVEVSARGASNVLIPLPAAAWSGLTVMGGVGLMAGLRKLRRRLR